MFGNTFKYSQRILCALVVVAAPSFAAAEDLLLASAYGSQQGSTLFGSNSLDYAVFRNGVEGESFQDFLDEVGVTTFSDPSEHGELVFAYQLSDPAFLASIGIAASSIEVAGLLDLDEPVAPTTAPGTSSALTLGSTDFASGGSTILYVVSANAPVESISATIIGPTGSGTLLTVGPGEIVADPLPATPTPEPSTALIALVAMSAGLLGRRRSS